MIPLFKILQGALESFYACLRSLTHLIVSCSILKDSLGYCRISYDFVYNNIKNNIYYLYCSFSIKYSKANRNSN